MPASPSHGKPKQGRGENVLLRFLDENDLMGSREQAPKSISGCRPRDPGAKDNHTLGSVHTCS
jgi:hypothetical protein